jgi:hypothetical protein
LSLRKAAAHVFETRAEALEFVQRHPYVVKAA